MRAGVGPAAFALAAAYTWWRRHRARRVIARYLGAYGARRAFLHNMLRQLRAALAAACQRRTEAAEAYRAQIQRDLWMLDDAFFTPSARDLGRRSSDARDAVQRLRARLFAYEDLVCAKTRRPAV